MTRHVDAAASATDPDEAETPSVEQRKPQRARKRPSGGSILMLIAILVGVLILAPTIQRVIAQRQEIAQIERDIAEAREDIRQIEADTARWDDPAYVKAEARGRLLFVHPGDTTYLVVDAEKYRTADVPVDLSTDVHESDTDPVALYVDSLIRAETAGAPQQAQGDS